MLFMLAQAGIPLTSGFVAKLDVFSAAADAGDYVLLVIGAVATVVAAFAYLRVALAVGGRPAERRRGSRAGRAHRASGRRRTWIVLAITAGVTLVLGIVPAVFVALGPGRHAPHPRHHLAQVATARQRSDRSQ